MSHFQGHRLCNKLEKWINQSCTRLNHSKTTSSEGTHFYHNAKNPNIFCSPYKKTSFETLLRKYPKNDQETKNNPKFTLDKQNDQSYGLKRTFQSRMIKYENIKCKVDTNLNALKNIKMKQNVLSFNDENKDTTNISFLQQQQTEKEILQNNLKKKIKLNNDQFEKFQIKKSNVWNHNDENNQCLINRDQNNKGSESQNRGKLMFKINISKKINMFGMNSLKSDSCDKQNQSIKEMQNNFNDSNQYHQNQQISVDENDAEIQDQENENEISSPHPLIFSSSSTKFVFKDLKQQQEDRHLEEDRNSNANNEIFCFDEHQIIEQSSDVNIAEQSVGQEEIPNNYQDIQISQDDKFELIQDKINCAQPEILIGAEKEKLYNLQEIIEEISEEIHEMKFTPDKSVHLVQSSQMIQSTLNLHSQVNQYNVDQIYDVNSTNLQNTEIFRDDQNKPKLSQQEPQQQKTSKIKHQKPKRQRKSKEETKILTRSNEEKLFLLNKLSMRLIRRKYGQDLTHTQLADKLLLDQNKVPLKAFLETECNQSKKFVFQFNQLTNSQMKSILTKYFMEEETKNAKNE